MPYQILINLLLLAGMVTLQLQCSSLRKLCVFIGDELEWVKKQHARHIQEDMDFLRKVAALKEAKVNG